MTTSETVLVAALTVGAIMLAGCGDALRINSTIARGMLETQVASSPIVREGRINAGIDAGRRAHSAGQTLEQAQAAAEQAADGWTCAIEGHRLFSLGTGAYIDAITLWESGDGFDLASVIPFLSRALDSYRFLSGCLLELGSNALPELPGFLRIIPPTWGVR